MTAILPGIGAESQRGLISDHRPSRRSRERTLYIMEIVAAFVCGNRHSIADPIPFMGCVTLDALHAGRLNNEARGQSRKQTDWLPQPGIRHP